MKLNLNREQWLLLISTVVMGIVAVACMSLGGMVGSNSLFFDGVSTLVATLISGGMFLVASLIARQNSSRFQFGYWHFEPLIILFECGFLLLAAAFAFYRGIDLLVHGGNHIPVGLVFFIELFFALLEFGYFLYLRAANRSVGSELVRMDGLGWFSDSCMSLAIALGFGLAWLAQGSRFDWLSLYMDGAALLLAATLVLFSVLGRVMPAVKQFLGVSPRALDAAVTGVVGEFVKKHGFVGFTSYVQEVGRSSVIEIHIILPSGFDVGAIDTLDAWREAIARQIGEASPDRWLSISFTAQMRWAD
ncbi:Cobalt-zinc-cadmium resistance protein [Pseudomonas chlororaphis]|uniref:Cobalt-zinc-cadmium resistance protein n=1 Tax=Pseudomonas chlororaphis TaxID=587753 RepID=A0A3G7TMJ3_9PSED|nr:cation transporter [Pseudomonas chlororaphis]AZE48325.1 Cobalt-zinc-cadmium resistance protein [Pseudomonas chlororaphis]